MSDRSKIQRTLTKLFGEETEITIGGQKKQVHWRNWSTPVMKDLAHRAVHNSNYSSLLKEDELNLLKHYLDP